MESRVTLRALRRARDLTQAEVGRALGLTQSAIAHYEAGTRLPSLQMARMIAEYFGVSLDDIAFGEPGPKAANE